MITKFKRFLRRISPLIALALLASFTWSAQDHLTDLQQFTYPDLVASTQATISDVTGAGSDESAISAGERRVRLVLNYSVNGQGYGRVMMLKITGQPSPKTGDTRVVHYIKASPETALLADEFAIIDEQISGMQIVVLVLGIATFMLPFMLLGFAKR